MNTAEKEQSGMGESASWAELESRVMMPTYKRIPVVFTRGKGTTLWDAEGNAYTDFLAGIAVVSLGHCREEVVQALASQAETLIHTSNLYYTIPQINLAKWLTDRCFADMVFFCNSGAEAIEGAIKLARRYFHEKGESERFKIMATEKSFHGRTYGALSATGQEKIKTGFAPVLPGFSFVPYNDTDALEKEMDETVAAFLVEPVQGEGGVRIPDPGYLKSVRRICDRNGALLIFDEIQTGLGRCGKLFAHEEAGVIPDMMTLAKALGNGLPIGALLATEALGRVFGPGSHATTFGGTPLIAQAALTAMEILEKENLPQKAGETGKYFLEKLAELKNRYPQIREVRGKGLLVAMELSEPCAWVVEKAFQKGFIINCIQDNVLRFAPPLVIEKNQIDNLIACLEEILGGNP